MWCRWGPHQAGPAESSGEGAEPGNKQFGSQQQPVSAYKQLGGAGSRPGNCQLLATAGFRGWQLLQAPEDPSEEGGRCHLLAEKHAEHGNELYRAGKRVLSVLGRPSSMSTAAWSLVLQSLPSSPQRAG